ncbi:MAG: hypothetical protein HYT62_01925 [Candidatus Yanofskybacteria bacterium]|nr:hypothetical protein [Candidatus Yanofskybacteria bacterium]
MDELNQIQNPNVPSSPLVQASQPSQGMSGQMPSVSQATMKKKNYLFPITVLVLIAVGAFTWWYIGQMNDEPVVIEQSKTNQDAREDALINQALGGVDAGGNLDAEFQAIDTDLNSL